MAKSERDSKPKSTSTVRPKADGDSSQGSRTSAADQPAKPSASETSEEKLDAVRQAANQRTAQQADVLRDVVFPSFLASALAMDSLIDSKAYKVFLERLVEDAGSPTDPIERMLLEQLALAHFRIGQLHVRASQAEGIESVRVYNSVAARMLGEFRRTVLALRICQAGVPKKKAEGKLKIHKLAQ